MLQLKGSIVVVKECLCKCRQTYKDKDKERFYYHLHISKMTNQNDIYCFHVCSTCEREKHLLMFMNFTHEYCNWVGLKKFIQELGWVEDLWKVYLNVIKIVSIASNETLKPLNLFRAKYVQLTGLKIHAPMLWMVDNMMGSNMYWCMQFSRSMKNIVLQLGTTYLA